jgi:N-acetylglucosamine-6-phosphate deacetylase
VGAGHTECTADEYRCAADCGLKVAIHLTNGPTGGSYKPFGGGGAMEAILTSRRVVAEVITDGYHVNPAYVMDIIERKGYDRIVVVTDGMFASDAQGVGEFTRTGIRGRVSDDGRYLQVAGKKDTLFGSVLTMDAAFANVVSWYTAGLNGIWTRRHRPLDLEPAVLRTSRMMSRNPAELLGIFRAKTDAAGVHAGTGSIEVVKRADIVLARLTGKPGSYRLDVRHTFVGGKKL